jgi:hypothetical protein
MRPGETHRTVMLRGSQEGTEEVWVAHIVPAYICAKMWALRRNDVLRR